MTKDHTNRIQDELKAVGISTYGRWRAESRYLPKIIHQDEHIDAAVLGRSELGAAMLVATDKRVIFIDKKPLFVSMDEIAYDMVSGVKQTINRPFGSVTLHTRVKDYALSFVNLGSAKGFVRAIEKKRLGT